MDGEEVLIRLCLIINRAGNDHTMRTNPNPNPDNAASFFQIFLIATTTIAYH